MDEKARRDSESTAVSHNEEGRRRKSSYANVDFDKLSTAFDNPLTNISHEQLMSDVENFCKEHDLEEHLETFKKGALVAQNPDGALKLTELTDEDKAALEREHTHRWHQPFILYWLVIMCSMAAAVQGMDETANNGAQALYIKQLNITAQRFGGKDQANYMLGLVVGAPYLACAVLGCWLTQPLNRVFARRGTIFISCFVAAVASIWEGVCNTWVNLFIARFVLGLGIGSKSSTVPVYGAECTPAPIRGALVMQWQMWTGKFQFLARDLALVPSTRFFHPYRIGECPFSPSPLSTT